MQNKIKEMVEKNRNPKVAIVHDWLYGGGAEQVVFNLHKLYPKAPIYTSYCTSQWQEKLNNKVITGYLNRWPFTRLRKILVVPRILWFKKLNLKSYDLVIISSGNGEAKFVSNLKPGAKTIFYCHTPVHFYWDKYDEYLKAPGFGIFNPIVRLSLKILVGPLKKADYKAAQKPDVIIANSSHIASKIKQYYNRMSTVIYPPVNLNKLKKDISKERTGLITVGRQVPYKRIDLFVEAAKNFNMPLKIVGDGPVHKELLKQATGLNNVSFYRNISDDHLAELLAGSKLFVFTAIEDFGIAPVEALASGTPVVAFNEGGSLDYVNEKTGILFNKYNAESLSKAVEKALNQKWNHSEIQQFAGRFSEERFAKQMDALIKKEL